MIKMNIHIHQCHDTGVVFLHKPIKISVIKIRKMPAAPNRYNRLDCEFCAKSGMPIRSIFPPANTQTIPAIKSRYMGNYFFHSIILLIYALFNLQQQKNNTDAHESMTNSCNPGNRSVQSFT